MINIESTSKINNRVLERDAVDAEIGILESFLEPHIERLRLLREGSNGKNQEILKLAQELSGDVSQRGMGNKPEESVEDIKKETERIVEMVGNKK